MGRRHQVLAGTLAIAVMTLSCIVAAAPAIAATPTPPVITTKAGTGVKGYGGDGGPATSAKLDAPTGVVEDSAGDIYFADTANNRIRRVTPAGVITTVAGTGVPGYSGDGGPATSAKLHAPAGVALDTSGDLFIADSGNNRIRKVSSGGIITTIAGNGGLLCGLLGTLLSQILIVGPALNATLCIAQSLLSALLPGLFPPGLAAPIGLAVDGAGNVYVADAGNNVVRKIDPRGTISVYAGTGVAGSKGDGGPAKKAQLSVPTGVSLDALGDLYISDSGNNKVRKVAPSGIITTFAGTGAAGYGGDGSAATSAKLFFPSGVGTDAMGDVFVTDTINCRIREVNTQGLISTYAGTGICGYAGDGGPATAAELKDPVGSLAVDANNVFLGDTLNNRVRQIVSGPGPVIPETPLAIALPLTALIVLGAGYALVSRRRKRWGLALAGTL